MQVNNPTNDQIQGILHPDLQQQGPGLPLTVTLKIGALNGLWRGAQGATLGGLIGGVLGNLAGAILGAEIGGTLGVIAGVEETYQATCQLNVEFQAVIGNNPNGAQWNLCKNKANKIMLRYIENVYPGKNRLVQEELICPISHELLIFPFKAADGKTYEHDFIRAWYNNNPGVQVLSP